MIYVNRCMRFNQLIHMYMYIFIYTHIYMHIHNAEKREAMQLARLVQRLCAVSSVGPHVHSRLCS